MKKLLLLFAVMLSTVGAWAQAYQKVPHTKWTVTAPNQSSTSGNEGGVAFIKDENPSTFYHSDWGGTQPGKNGLQGFLIDMAEEMTDIYKITYTGRSDNNTSGWARGVKIYMYNTLPDDLPADLSTLSHDEKETLFNDATVLGTPAFDNTESPWANDRTLKTATFTEAKTARYVLFVMHSGNDAWLTCSDFHVWQKVDGVVEDKPYFLKITNAAGEGEWYLDTHTPIADNQGLSTIGKSANSVATYFSLVDGYWNISTKPGRKGDFVSVSKWCAPPQSAVGARWTVVKNSDGTVCLKQYDYLGGGDVNRNFLGGDIISNAGVVKVYTDNLLEKAVKIELVELSELEAAKETARQCLSKIGVGYPALDSEARTTLQAAIDAQDATVESVNAAIEAYQSNTQEVVMPEAGKVYRFVSADPKFYSNQKVYKALYSDNGELKWKNLDATAMNQLWSVENVSGVNITFYNVQDATYPQNSAFSSPVRMLNAKNEGSLVFLGKGQFKIQPNKLQGIHANNHGSGTGNNGNAINYNTDADAASAWYIEEVAVTKEILAAQINAVRTAYIGSVLIKEEGIAGLSDAVTAAQTVHDENGNYAQALASLAAAVKNATIEYIDLGYFYMKSKAAGKYAYNDNTALKVTDSKVLKGIFKFTKAKNGSFYVQNGNGFYAQGVNTSQLVQTSSAKKAYHVNKMPSGHYVLRPEDATGTHQFLHDANNGTGNIVGWSTEADNTQWTFEVLSEEELAKIYTVNMSVGADAYVTYKGTYEGGDKDVKADGGFYVLDSSPAVVDFTVNGVTDGLDSKVFVSGRDITVVGGHDTENIYIIRSKNSSSYARYHSGCTMSATDDTNMLTYENNNLHWESLFYIEEGAGDYTGYYTIRPVSAPNLYVYNLNSADEDSKVATKERPTEGVLTANYYWKISTFGAEYANITPYGADDCGWNKRGSYDGKNHIGYWKGHNNADANKWMVRKVEEELIPHTTDDSALGLVTYESAQPMLPYIKLVTSENLSKVKGTKFDVVLPKQGEFYRLKNQFSNRYMTAESNAVKVYDECNDQSTIFYVDADNTLLSYAFGRYLDCGNKVLSNVGTKYNGTFAKKCGVSYLPNVLAYNNNGAWTYGNRGNGESIDRGTGNQPTTDEGYNWVFEPVTTLPVTITDAGYATFYSPVAVTLPEGLQAFYVSETTDNYAKMAEIVGGVIPANTGVILQGAENTYNLTIGGEAVAVEDNKLSGTAAATYITEDAYVLSKVNEVVGFNWAAQNQQSNSSWLNNAFKAYLPATTAESRFLVFNFGDDTETAIEGIEAENTADAVVYDLAGRRVQKAQKGLYIVNGKKVIK